MTDIKNTGPKKSKKELILDAALTLFAEKGFDGVGVDEIAEAVGMKGPALYYYFKGKDSILEEIISTNEAYYSKNFTGNEEDMKMPSSLEEFIQASMARLQFSIHDPQIKKIRRVLAQEQFRNPRIAALTTYHHLTGVEEMNKVMIMHLQELGLVGNYDPGQLAFELTAPVSMLIHVIDREPEREEEMTERIHKHLKHFADTYGVK